MRYYVFSESDRYVGRLGPFPGQRRGHENQRRPRGGRLHQKKERLAGVRSQTLQIGVPAAGREHRGVRRLG